MSDVPLIAVSSSVAASQVGGADYTLPQLALMVPQYNIVRDCLLGEIAVKSRDEKYLPIPNPTDQSAENIAKYKNYKRRACFVNVAARTLEGLIGQIFLREPNTKVPAALDNLVKDVNGLGVTLNQQAKESAKLVLSYGRAGLFTDYPNTETATTKAQLDDGNIRPTINLYEPWNIINWRVIKQGANLVLSLVVLKEQYVDDDDGFAFVLKHQWRVLRLVEGLYEVDIFKENGQHENFKPLDAAGNRINSIPFVFLGVTKNDHFIDPPPLYDICSINLAHYRNSADYEQSCFQVGQPTPVFAGLTEDWAKEVLGGSVQLGSANAVLLPVGGSAELLQPSANTMPKEAMDAKEHQMFMLGAKLVQEQKVQRTATQASIENTSETSILSAVANNVAEGIKFCLEWAAIMVGSTTISQDANSKDSIDYELNAEFDLQQMSSLDRAQLLKEWQSGGITWTEYRDNLKRAGVATQDDDEAKTEIEQEQAAQQQNVLDQMAAQLDVTGGAPTNNKQPPAKKPATGGNA